MGEKKKKKSKGHSLNTTIGIYTFLGAAFVSLIFLAHKNLLCKKILNVERTEKTREEQNI